MSSNTSGTSIDLESLDLETDKIDSLELKLNKLIEIVNLLNKNISLTSNFNCYIAEVKIPATSSIKIQHFLGVVPKYRIILRQTGNGVITDIPSDWNNKVIALYNNGAVEVRATVMIVRE